MFSSSSEATGPLLDSARQLTFPHQKLTLAASALEATMRVRTSALGNSEPPCPLTPVRHSRLVIAGGALLLGFLACATRSPTGGENRQSTLEGAVIDEQTGTSLAGVSVALCGVAPHRNVVWGNMFPACGADVTSTITDSAGRFRLPWSPDDRSLAGATVAFTSTGYSPQNLPIDAITRLAPSNKSVVRLRRAPVVDVTIVDAQGHPIRGAGVGWFVERPGALQMAQSCCSDERGRLSWGPDGIPEGRITFFSAIGGNVSKVGIATIESSAGANDSVTLRVSQPLQRLHGHVVDAGGENLAAVVDVEPAEPDALSALDRALLEIHGPSTDLEGDFDFRIASSALVEVRLSTWGGLDEGGPGHVWLSPLAAVTARFGPKSESITLRAPAARVVRCTMTGSDGATLGVGEVSIFFAPHKVSGHTGGCAWVGGRARDGEDGPRPKPREVRFIWPSGAQSLIVTARSASDVSRSGDGAESHSLVGKAVLDNPATPCEINGS
jgi:hypothetical protein